MHDGISKSRHRREPPSSHRRRSWCCSFAVPPHSPESHQDTGKSRHSFSAYSKNLHNYTTSPKKNELPHKSSQCSYPNSPQSQASTTSSSKLGLRRILSPGRVSPIDEPAPVAAKSAPKSSSAEIPRSPLREYLDADARASRGSAADEGSLGNFDVRLSLKAKNGGGSLILELSSAVLSSNSAVFARLISDYRRDSAGLCRIEVPEVENLNTFRDTIELMFEEKIPEKLVHLGVRRATDILEVAASIKFSRGVLSCLKFLEAVPWSEEEEEKLRILFTKCKFDDATSKDIMTRLYGLESENPAQNLAEQLLWSITTCFDTNAGNELKSLVKGLLSKSSVYEKTYDVNRGDILAVCQSSLNSLLSLFEEATGTSPNEKLVKIEKNKPLIERISKHVENLNWLLEILIDHQMAEGLVDMWADQKEILRMHKCVSPMIRYELSRVSAMLFIAMGNRKVRCCSETRLSFLQAWFRPMLLDFGWLQRCKKGLDMKVLEEAMGQAILTLPLKEQHQLFMDWFSFFSKHGSECPNLSKAFQVWWRRSFVRGSDSFAIESR